MVARRKSNRQETSSSITETAKLNSNNESSGHQSIEVLINQAREALFSLDYESARSIVHTALNQDSNHLGVLSLAGEIYVELDDYDTAREIFTRGAQLDESGEEHGVEEEPWVKYLWLAQLSEVGGHESLKMFEKGAKKLQAASKMLSSGSNSNQDQDQDLADRLASVYSSIAELYMRDLCDETEAEILCEQYIMQALSISPHGSEPLQTLASLRISQQRPDEAVSALKSNLAVWKDLSPDSPLYPAYSSRMALTRLLMETGLLDEAIWVLNGLRETDDEVVDLWYLLGWAWYLQGKKNNSDVRKRNWTESAACLTRCKRLYERYEWDDMELLEHTNELLLELIQEGIEPKEDEIDNNWTDDENGEEDEDEEEDEEDEEDENVEENEEMQGLD